MSFKIATVDMDGTLLNDKHEISEFDKEVIEKLRTENIEFVLTTGRILYSAKYYAKYNNLSDVIISCNGAFAYDTSNDVIIYERYLEKEVAKEILELLEKEKMYYHFYEKEKFYAKELKYNSKRYYEWNKDKSKEDRLDMRISPDIEKVFSGENIKVHKIVVMDEDLNRLRKIQHIIEKNKDLEVVSSLKNSFDIMKKGATKGEAIKALAKYRNISVKDIVAIGDNHNDISMLKIAGTSVAMGNAEEEVKEVATFTTETNNESGVGKAILKILNS